MPALKYLEVDEFWLTASKLPVLDVRSPNEFAQGHFPNAINLPLFDDEERANIGTLYKNSGNYHAVLRGLQIAGKKQAQLVDQAFQLAGGKKLLMYCWRGGLRSLSLAQITQMTGVEVSLLQGGYKSFRKFARDYFGKPWHFVVISGLTGSGKTNLLVELKRMGQQVLDLESLARHRGSSFGGIDQEPQPTTEQFENLMFQELAGFDPRKTIWIEDESNRIGKVVVPQNLFLRLRNSPAIFLELERQRRVENLLADYGKANPADLQLAIDRISKRMDGLQYRAASEALASGDLATAVHLVLDYYDKRYLTALPKIPRQTMVRLLDQTGNLHSLASRVIEIGESLNQEITVP